VYICTEATLIKERIKKIRSKIKFMPLNKIWISLRWFSGNVEIFDGTLGRSLIESFKENDVIFIFMSNKWCTCAQIFGGIFDESIYFEISKGPI
jgi:hypothetical protein